MQIIDVEHNSTEWYQLRCGRLTSSAFKQIVTPVKCKLSAQSDEYMYELIGEKATGLWDEGFRTNDMLRGQMLEPAAADLYELMTGTKTRKGVFILDDTGMIGASPDRLVDDDGCLEIKCPKLKTHIKYMVKGIEALGNDYKPQYMGHLMLTGRKFVDVFSYHPEMQPVLIRVERDDEYIEKLETALNEFIVKMGETIEQLTKDGYLQPTEEAA